MTNVLDTPEQIAAFRLRMVIRAFESEVNTGMKLTSRMPRVKDIVRQYGLPESVRTEKQLVEALKDLEANLREHDNIG